MRKWASSAQINKLFMEPKFSFCLNPFIDEQNGREYMLKVSSDFCELNILLSKDELLKIPDVANARWNERTSLKLGDCLDNPTWWSAEKDGLSILVGADDETWQFGILLPHSAMQDLLDEIDVDETRIN